MLICRCPRPPWDIWLVQGRKSDSRVIKERNKDVYEVSPNENAVVMEEQLMKVSESSMNYKLASSIYSKNLLMFKMALNGSGR